MPPNKIAGFVVQKKAKNVITDPHHQHKSTFSLNLCAACFGDGENDSPFAFRPLKWELEPKPSSEKMATNKGVNENGMTQPKDSVGKLEPGKPMANKSPENVDRSHRKGLLEAAIDGYLSLRGSLYFVSLSASCDFSVSESNLPSTLP